MRCSRRSTRITAHRQREKIFAESPEADLPRALARRGPVEKVKSSKDADVKRNWKYAPLPDSVGKLIPTDCYSQFEKWYSVMRKLILSYTPKNKEFVNTFRV